MKICTSLGLLAWSVFAQSHEPAEFTPEQLRSDLTFMESALARTHPDVAHSVDPARLAGALADMRARLDHPMSADEAWKVLSGLNPLMADGHLTVSYPGGPAAEMQRHLANGGRLFPYAVHVTGTALFVRSRLRIYGAESATDGSRDLPAAYRQKSFEELFQFELLDDQAALLTINEFYWSAKPRFHQFTRAAFERMRDAGTRTLIIDIHANAGGDDDLWIEGILPYFATRPFRNGSTYVLKIIEGRAKEGQKVGDVVRGAQDSVYPPQLDHPLRFQGNVHVLISPRTYSSAVLFSTVVQDHGFGTLVGVGGGARSTQSGGAQFIKLPHTQMTFVVPRFVLTRTSGRGGLLEPDVLIVDDPFRPRAAIESVLRLAPH